MDTSLLIFWPVALAGAAYGARLAIKAAEAFRSPLNKHLDRHSDAVHTMQAQGFSYAEAISSIRVREEMARLRRESSEAVKRDPANWIAILQDQKAEAGKRLMEDDRALASMFAAMLMNCTYRDILYPDAVAVIRREQEPIVISQDQLAALVVLR